MIKSYKYGGDKWHVVNSFIDKEQKLFVVKRWRKAKQRWHYEVLTEQSFNFITQR